MNLCRILLPIFVLTGFNLYPLPAQMIEKTEIERAIEQAKKDARKDVNEIKWGIIGCTSLIVGVTHARSPFITAPSADRFLGKSRQYVEAYETEYYSQAKEIRTRSALIGCFAGTIIYTVVIVQGVRYVEGYNSDVGACSSGEPGETTKEAACCLGESCLSGK
jgi:hypothetical protein